MRERGMHLARVRLSDGEVWFEASRCGRCYTLDWPRAGRYKISPDGGVTRCLKRQGPAISRVLLGRMVQAYARSLRGNEALHATVLARERSAVAFLGPSGTGKSTLAACLLGDPRTRLLSDDLLYARIVDDRAWVLPDEGFLKLSPAARAWPGLGAGEFDPNLEKTVYRIGKSPATPLVGIVLLKRGGTAFRLRRSRGARSTLTLIANMYNALFTPPMVIRNQFALAVALSRRVPVWGLSYPSGFGNLPLVARLVERLWRRSRTPSGIS